MLIVPKQGLSFQFSADDGQCVEFAQCGVAGHLLIHKTTHPIPSYYNLGSNPAVYIDCRYEDWEWGGVYKHHYVLVGGYLCIIDGYQFQHVEPLNIK